MGGFALPGLVFGRVTGVSRLQPVACCLQPLSSPRSSRRLRSDHKIHVALEHLKQRQELIDRLPVVRLIQQPVQLGCRRPEPPDDLAFGQRAPADPLLRLQRQPVEQQISQVVGLLVELEHLLHVHGPCAPRPEFVGSTCQDGVAQASDAEQRRPGPGGETRTGERRIEEREYDEQERLRRERIVLRRVLRGETRQRYATLVARLQETGAGDEALRTAVGGQLGTDLAAIAAPESVRTDLAGAIRCYGELVPSER